MKHFSLIVLFVSSFAFAGPGAGGQEGSGGDVVFDPRLGAKNLLDLVEKDEITPVIIDPTVQFDTELFNHVFANMNSMDESLTRNIPFLDVFLSAGGLESRQKLGRFDHVSPDVQIPLRQYRSSKNYVRIPPLKFYTTTSTLR